MSRIIVTGAAGFIGSNLCKKLLETEYTVIGIDNFVCGYKENLRECLLNPLFSFHELTINSKELTHIIKKDDIVIHLAAISSLASNQEDPVFSYHNNICGTINLLEISRVNGVKHFIFASSSAIYENNKEFPLKESSQTSPNLIYSIGKKHCEELIQTYYENYGLTYSILRFFNVYGPKQDSQRKHPALIPYIIDCFQKNTAPVLHSDGNQKRDYVFIEDILELFATMIKGKPINDIINVSSGTVVSVKEIFEIVKSNFPSSRIEPIYNDPTLLWEKSSVLWSGVMPFSRDRMRQEVDKYTIGDTTKSEPTWKTKIDIRTGIHKCI